MLTRLSLLASMLLLLLAFAMPVASAAERPFAVITAPGVAERHPSREAISLIFKRKQKYWENGTRIQPVNLPASSPLRRTFSQYLLGQLPEAMEDYWREMYFHGVLPPHVLESEEAVILFVSSTPGAIGYVSTCLPEHGVNVVLLVGELPPCPR
jgi:ABC-type phosphate transport system substrate-binding protein